MRVLRWLWSRRVRRIEAETARIDAELDVLLRATPGEVARASTPHELLAIVELREKREGYEDLVDRHQLWVAEHPRCRNVELCEAESECMVNCHQEFTWLEAQQELALRFQETLYQQQMAEKKLLESSYAARLSEEWEKTPMPPKRHLATGGTSVGWLPNPHYEKELQVYLEKLRRVDGNGSRS